MNNLGTHKNDDEIGIFKKIKKIVKVQSNSQIHSILENSLLLECDIVTGWVAPGLNKENYVLILDGQAVLDWLHL